jgi:hypothetical protein
LSRSPGLQGGFWQNWLILDSRWGMVVLWRRDVLANSMMIAKATRYNTLIPSNR